MAHSVRVVFRGDSSGEEYLTWGQLTAWRKMVYTDSSVPVGGVAELGEGTTIEQVAAVLGFLMSRHQSLRLRLRVDESGEPRQVVAATGETALEVVDADDGDDPAGVADRLRQRYEDAPFDHAVDWPVRWGVVRHQGRPTHVVAVYPHIVVDAYGFEALRADLANLDLSSGRPLAPVTAVQPLELAREQRGPAGRRRNDAALRHWDQQLRTVPARRFADSGVEPETPVYLGRCTSPAGHLAVRAIGVRTGVHSGSILLGAWAVAVANLTGVHPSVIRVQVSNRFRRGLENSVTTLAQYGLCIMDTRDRDLDDVIGQAWRGLVEAGKYGYCNPMDLWDLIDRVGAERGEELKLDCFYNDRRGSLLPPESGPVPTPEEILAVRDRTRIAVGPHVADAGVECGLHINATPGTLDYEVKTQIRFVPPDQVERLVRDVEEILIAAAVAPTPVRRPSTVGS